MPLRGGFLLGQGLRVSAILVHAPVSGSCVSNCSGYGAMSNGFGADLQTFSRISYCQRQMSVWLAL